VLKIATFAKPENVTCKRIGRHNIKKTTDINKKKENHFDNLNKRLEEEKVKERYYFKILSDVGSDISDFFQSMKDKKYKV